VNIPLYLLVTSAAETRLKEGHLRRLMSMLNKLKPPRLRFGTRRSTVSKRVSLLIPRQERRQRPPPHILLFTPRMLPQTKLHLKKSYYNGSSFRSQQFTNQVHSQRRAARGLLYAKYGSPQSCPSRDLTLIAVRSLGAARLHSVKWRGLLWLRIASKGRIRCLFLEGYLSMFEGNAVNHGRLINLAAGPRGEK